MKKIREEVATRGAEAALLTFLPDIRWACGFTGSNGLLLVGPDAAHFVTDGRYAGQAAREVHGAHVHVAEGNLFEHVASEELLAGIAAGAPHVLFQADHVTVAKLDRLRELFPAAEWVAASRLLTEHVARKTSDEIDKISAAQRITEHVFEHVVSRIAPGRTEREVAAEIVFEHLRRGAERVAFEPIVASGPNGALPHARPSDRVLRAGDLVVLDMGCFAEGYASDMTRTVAVGEPSDEARAVYAVVRRAQQAAVEAARAGMTTKALDAVARGVIEEAGYGDHFPHSLGHGVGLQVHEWPRVSYRFEHVLPEGAVVTIEPGVYVPERFGVRIEDMVVLRGEDAENLTRATKELLVL